MQKVQSQLGGACHLALRAISIDPIARVVRVSLEDRQARRFDGAEYERLTGGLAQLARVAVNEARPRNPNFRGTPSDAGFWQDVYATRHDGFELGRAAPPLERWFAAHPPAGLTVLNVGCGRGHDARMLARLGGDVVAVDFVPEVIAEAQALAVRDGVRVDFRVRDLFQLPNDPERYALSVEHCAFCAIDPARREEYVRVITELLSPGATWVGLFWSHGRPGGPPFTISRPDLERLLAPHFIIDHLEVPADSVALRHTQELLLSCHKR